MRNKCSPSNELVRNRSLVSMGNSNVNSAKERYIFYLVEVSFKSNSGSIGIHLEYLPMIIIQEKICYMGLVCMIIVIHRSKKTLS
jgi:hypothetical protein